MGPKKGIFIAVLAAVFLVVPAAASAAPQFSASVNSVEFVGPNDPSGAFDPFDQQTFESSVTVTNTGDMNITSVEPSLASAPGESPFMVTPAPFAVSPGNCDSYNPGIGLPEQFQIGLGESCQFKVQFNPSGLSNGEHTDTLKLRAFGMPGQIEGNAVEIPLSAEVATNSNASVTPSSLDMGLVPADTTTTKSVTLTSTGTSQMILNGNAEITLPDGSYSLTPAFSFSRPDECLRMDPGESCEIKVSFTPPNYLSYQSILWLRGNFGTIQVPLSGSGSDPQAEVTPNLRFGEKIIGNSYTGTATLTSSGLSPISVDSAAISGPAASSFSVDYDAGKCLDLGFQDTCDFEVSFNPTKKGSHKAALVVTGNFGTKTINLSGSARKGTPPKLDVRIFGPRRAAPGSTVTLKAKIYNRGEVVAKGVNLKTLVPTALAAKVKPIRIKQVAAGKPVTEKIRIKVKGSAKAGNWLKIGFTVSAKSARSGKSTRSLRIR